MSEEYHLDEGFKKFWELYPRKERLFQAEQAWKELNPDEKLQQEIFSKVEKGVRSGALTFKYAPSPWRWLTERRWTDEYPEPEDILDKMYKK